MLAGVQTAAQYLQSQIPPQYHPNIRHPNNSKTISYKLDNSIESWEKVEDDEELLLMLEQSTLKERGDIAGYSEEIVEPMESEISSSIPTFKDERTGVTHLVHSWYPIGHNVSDHSIHSLAY